MEIGPIQIIAVGFIDPKLDGSVLGALMDASDAGHIKVIDVIGVYKDVDGTILAAEASDLSEDEAMEYGAWVGALVGLGAGGVEGAEVGAIVGAVAAAENYERLRLRLAPLGLVRFSLSLPDSLRCSCGFVSLLFSQKARF